MSCNAERERPNSKVCPLCTYMYVGVRVCMYLLMSVLYACMQSNIHMYACILLHICECMFLDLCMEWWMYITINIHAYIHTYIICLSVCVCLSEWIWITTHIICLDVFSYVCVCLSVWIWMSCISPVLTQCKVYSSYPCHGRSEGVEWRYLLNCIASSAFP